MDWIILQLEYNRQRGRCQYFYMQIFNRKHLRTLPPQAVHRGDVVVVAT
jgi:hypothetical protein